MADVKIILGPNESELDADLKILKALQSHVNGDAHSGEAFSDPAMADVAAKLEQAYAKMYANMIREIVERLEREYHGGNIARNP